MQTEALQLTVNSKGAQADLSALSSALDKAGSAFERMEKKVASGAGKIDSALGRALTQSEKAAKIAVLLGKVKVDGSASQSLVGFANALDALGRARSFNENKLKGLRDFVKLLPSIKVPAGANRLADFLNAVGAAKAPSAATVRNMTAFMRLLANYKGTGATRNTAALTAFLTAVSSARAPSQSVITRLESFLKVLSSARPIPNARKIADDLTLVAAAANRASVAFAGLPRHMSALTAPTVAAGRATATLNQHTNQFGAGARAMGAGAQQARGHIQGLHTNLGALNERFRLGYQVGTIFTAMFSSFTIGQFVKGIYESGIQVAKLQKAMLYTTGTFRGAQQATGQYMAMAQRLGLSIDKTIESYGRFMISAKASGVGAASANRTFESISMALQVVGASAEQTQYAFYGLTQMMQKGKVSSEELNRQIGEQIPGSAVAAANALSKLEGKAVSVSQMFKQVASGMVLSSVFTPAYAEELRKMYEPLMALASKRPDVALNRLTNAWKLFLVEVGNQGFMKGLGGGFSSLADQMVMTQDGVLKLTPRFEELARTIGGNLAKAVRTVTDFIKILMSHLPEVVKGVKAIIEVKLAMTLVDWATKAGDAAKMFSGMGKAAYGAAGGMAAMNAAQAGAGAATAVAAGSRAARAATAASAPTLGSLLANGAVGTSATAQILAARGALSGAAINTVTGGPSAAVQTASLAGAARPIITPAGPFGRQQGMRLYHGSGNGGLSLEDITTDARVTRQGRAAKYGGFYAFNKDQFAKTERYSKMGGDTPSVYEIALKKDAKIHDLARAGEIERLTAERMAELRAQGVQVVRGKGTIGSELEHAVIDKNAIESVRRMSPGELPGAAANTAFAAQATRGAFGLGPTNRAPERTFGVTPGGIEEPNLVPAMRQKLATRALVGEARSVATVSAEARAASIAAKGLGAVGAAGKVAAGAGNLLLIPFKPLLGLFGKLGPTLAGVARGAMTLVKGFGPIALLVTAATFALTKFLGATTEIDGKKAKVSNIVGAGFSMIGDGIKSWWKSSSNPLTAFGLKMDDIGKKSGGVVVDIMAAFVWLANSIGIVMQSIGDAISKPFKTFAEGIDAMKKGDLAGAAKAFAASALQATPIGVMFDAGSSMVDRFTKNGPDFDAIRKQISDRATAKYAEQNAGPGGGDDANKTLDDAAEQQIMAALAQQKAAQSQLQAAMDLQDATAHFKDAIKPLTFQDLYKRIDALKSGQFLADYKSGKSKPDPLHGDAGTPASVQQAIDKADSSLKASNIRVDQLNKEVTLRHPEIAVGRVMSTARSMLGQDEHTERGALSGFFAQGAGLRLDPEKTAWCAAFVNAVLGSNGIKGTGQLGAKSFMKFGEATSKPTEGDIVVLNRGNRPDQGHVGFFEGFTKEGRVRVLGGNQGKDGAVSESSFPAAQVAGYRHWSQTANALPATTAITNAKVKPGVDAPASMADSMGINTGDGSASGGAQPDVLGTGNIDTTSDATMTAKRMTAYKSLQTLLASGSPLQRVQAQQQETLASLASVVSEEEELIKKVPDAKDATLFSDAVIDQIKRVQDRAAQEMADAQDPISKDVRLNNQAYQVSLLRAKGLGDEADYQEKINGLIEEGYLRKEVDNEATRKAYMDGLAQNRQLESEIDLRKKLNEVGQRAFNRSHTGAFDQALYAAVEDKHEGTETHQDTVARLQKQGVYNNLVQGVTASTAEDSAASIQTLQQSLQELQATYRLNPTAKAIRDDYKQALQEITHSSATTLAGLEADATDAQRAMAKGFADARAAMENQNGFQRWADQLEPFAKRMNDIKANFVDTLSSGITDALSGDKVDWGSMLHNMSKQVLKAQVDTALQSIIHKVTGAPATPEQAQTAAAQQQTTAAQSMGQAAQSHMQAAAAITTAAQQLGAVAQIGAGGSGASPASLMAAANDNGGLIAPSNIVPIGSDLYNAAGSVPSDLTQVLPGLSAMGAEGGTHNYGALAAAAGMSALSGGTHNYGALAAGSSPVQFAPQEITLQMPSGPTVDNLIPPTPIIPIGSDIVNPFAPGGANAMPTDLTQMLPAALSGFKPAGAQGGAMGGLGAMGMGVLPGLLAWLTRPKTPKEKIVDPLNGLIGTASTNTVEGTQVAGHANMIGSLLSMATGMAGAAGFGAPGGNLTKFFQGGGSMQGAMGNFMHMFSLPGFSEGGYSTSPVHSITRAVSFHDVPRYKEGTANTSNEIPAILHPNEAVVPLSRGRAIPIEGDLGGSTHHVTVNSPIYISTPDADSFRSSQSALQSKQNKTIRRAAMRNLSAAA